MSIKVELKYELLKKTQTQIEMKSASIFIKL